MTLDDEYGIYISCCNDIQMVALAMNVIFPVIQLILVDVILAVVKLLYMIFF